MNSRSSQGRIPEVLLRATEHWSAQRQATAGGSPEQGYTIAISRQVGARGTTVARAIGERLGWPVFDHELLERIAQETHLRVGLLESVDERRMSWIEECMEAFSTQPLVSESKYVWHLIQTLLSLSGHGECVIVGRGAALILPPATTLRVRLIAWKEDRIAEMSRLRGLSHTDAVRLVEETDRERDRFSLEHFQKNPSEAEHYDLLLNSSRFSVAECVDLIVEGLHRLQRHGAVPPHAKV